MVKEYCAKFITGELSMETDSDPFIEQLDAMGMDGITEAFQAAYDRYMDR